MISGVYIFSLYLQDEKAAEKANFFVGRGISKHFHKENKGCFK
jgi:hypothetical protein